MQTCTCESDMKFVKLSENQYLNLDHVSAVKYDSNDGDCMVYFVDGDVKMYLEKDAADILKKFLEDRRLSTTEELFKRYGIPWPPKEDDKADDIIKSYPKSE